jgi:asparagine synthase (glutamine-hydrolysing)
MRKNLIAPAAAAYPEWGWLPRPLRAKTTLTSISQNAMQGYFRAMCAIPDTTRTNLYSDSFKSSLSGYSAIGVFEQAASSFAGSPDSFDFIQHIDLQTWLSGDINVKADRTSMAHSLEVREPLLDHVLMEWAASLPQALKVSPSGAKLILKEQARRMVPPDVVDRPKQGFSVPMERWFKGPLAARLEAMLSGELATFVNPLSVRTLLNQHRSGARNHDRALWTVFSLGNFLQAKGSASDA